MTRKTIIAGNWKMHKTLGETTSFIKALIPHAKKAGCEIRIAPPFTAISTAAAAAKGIPILIGGQDMCEAEEGAFTGAISARMLLDAGAQFVLLGHSERRQLFGETDEKIHLKMKRAVLEAIPPVLCIGETEAEKDAGETAKVLIRQLDIALNTFSAGELKTLVVAYEPVWAIGTGKTATPEMAQEAHRTIRTHIDSKWGEDFAQNLSILYGGSVKPDNIGSLLNQPDVDGALIGGASLDVEAFGQMVQR